MKVYRHTKKVAECLNGAIVAVGNFDGVHKGHQKLLLHLIHEAKKENLPAIVLTFEPHPRHVFSPADFEGRITPFADKARLLRDMGVDVVYSLRFTKAYSATTAEVFIEEILLSTLKARHVVVGEDFCFGSKRLGDVALLKEYGHKNDFSVEAFGEIQNNGGERYASQYIRKLLAHGSVKIVQDQLGRPFKVLCELSEDDMCNLRGNIGKYVPLKNAVYLMKISHQGEHVGMCPVAVKNGQVIIPPMKEIPDIPEGRYALEFVDQLAQ